MFQDAVKSVRVLEGPDHLLCTLKRFKYDNNRKSKIFTDLDYRLSIELPVATAAAEEEGRTETYELYAIVVHSGYSSDGGHYYTYAREPRRRPVEAEAEAEEQPWFIFNDSKVSFSSFESFKAMTSLFPRDAAYQLFYRRRGSSSDAAKVVFKRPLRADLKTAVDADNLRFLREKERVASGGGTITQNNLGKDNFKRDGDDDDDSAGGGGFGGGFNSPGRLVC